MLTLKRTRVFVYLDHITNRDLKQLADFTFDHVTCPWRRGSSNHQRSRPMSETGLDLNWSQPSDSFELLCNLEYMPSRLPVAIPEFTSIWSFNWALFLYQDWTCYLLAHISGTSVTNIILSVSTSIPHLHSLRALLLPPTNLPIRGN